MLTITLNGAEYDLATSLRVAYIVQGQNNHKSYLEVFKNIDTMNLEDQVAIIYAAFKVANPKVDTINQKNFLDYFLDNYTLTQLMAMLQSITEGIMGVEKTSNEEQADENPQ